MSGSAAQLRQVAAFTPNEFSQMVELIYRVAGIRLASHKQQFLESRLLKRAIELKINRYGEYLHILQQNEEAEILFLLEAITTHKTEWFREKPHFEFLTREVIPQASQKRDPLFVWSAASSTGEEAYSIACHLMMQGMNPSQFRIVGTDISEMVVQFASTGFYPNEGDHSVPGILIQKNYFSPATRNGKAGAQVKPEIMNQVKFRVMNLLEMSLPEKLKFDVIFLRNVLIYFDEKSTEKAIQNLLQKLNPDGHLIIGLSESLQLGHLGLKSLGQSIYRKTWVKE